MSAAYTSGLWRATGPNVRAGDALIAVVTDQWADVKTPETEKLANARLLAMAPEMLDLLYTVLPYIEDAELDPAYKSGAVARVTQQIRAAIQKAEGQA